MTAEPTFRTTSDAALLTELLADAMTGDADARRSRILTWLETGTAVVAVSDGRPAAAAIWHLEGDACIIEAIATHVGHRNKGLGRYLIEHMAAQRPALALVAETDDDAVDFYRSCGFTTTHLPERWPGVNRYRCVLQLPAR